MNFTSTPQQRALQTSARHFAKTVLADVRGAIRDLPTAQERFRATRPFFEELVRQGFLRKLIPMPFGGECTGMIDMALIAEEFHAVDVNVSLTALANILGLAPLMIAGTPRQQETFLPPFLETRGAPLAGFASSEPGGSANFAAPAPAEGVRTRARPRGRQLDGHRVEAVGFERQRMGWSGR